MKATIRAQKSFTPNFIGLKKSATFLIDTTQLVSVVKSSAFRENKKFHFTTRTVTLQGFGNQKEEINQWTTLQLEDGYSFDFYVIKPEFLPGFDGIIGEDFLVESGVVLDYKKKEIVINKIKFSMIIRLQAMVSDCKKCEEERVDIKYDQFGVTFRGLSDLEIQDLCKNLGKSVEDNLNEKFKKRIFQFEFIPTSSSVSLKSSTELENSDNTLANITDLPFDTDFSCLNVAEAGKLRNSNENIPNSFSDNLLHFNNFITLTEFDGCLRDFHFSNLHSNFHLLNSVTECFRGQPRLIKSAFKAFIRKLLTPLRILKVQNSKVTPTKYERRRNSF